MPLQSLRAFLLPAAALALAWPAQANWPTLGRISNRTAEPVILLLEEGPRPDSREGAPRIQVDRRDACDRQVMCRKGLQAVVIATGEDVYAQFQDRPASAREAFALVDGAGRSVRMVLARSEKRAIPTFWGAPPLDPAAARAELEAGPDFVAALDSTDGGLTLRERARTRPEPRSLPPAPDPEDQVWFPSFAGRHPRALGGAGLDLPGVDLGAASLVHVDFAGGLPEF